jgi:hypothetical protein
MIGIKDRLGLSAKALIAKTPKCKKMKITITLPPKKQRIRFAPSTKVIPDKKKKQNKQSCRQ